MRQTSLAGGLLGILLAITNSLRDDQLLPRKLADGDFVELGVSFIAVDRYHRADRTHKVTAVGEGVLVVGLFGRCCDAISDGGR